MSISQLPSPISFYSRDTNLYSKILCDWKGDSIVFGQTTSSFPMGFVGFVLRILVLALAWLKYRIFTSIKKYTSFVTAEFIPDRKKRVKLLQYNVSWPSSGEPYLKARLQEFSEKLADYDILILTGLHQSWNGSAKLFIEIAEVQGFKYYVSGPAPAFASLQYQDSGVFIFSRFPITWSDVASFNTSGIASLGAVYARVRISAFENAHFFAADLSKDATLRNKELPQLFDLIKRHVTDRFPVFVGGNFGINAFNGADYSTLKQAFVIPKRDIVDLGFQVANETPITYGAEGEVVLTPKQDRGSKQSLDFLFYLRPPQDWVIEKIDPAIETLPATGKFYRQLSSHYGISATLELREPD
jgi:endonuclease/exonuclease/phosphatase family metal-dependent hydrolase